MVFVYTCTFFLWGVFIGIFRCAPVNPIMIRVWIKAVREMCVDLRGGTKWSFWLFGLSFQGSAAQEPILRSARSMLDSSTQLLKSARSLILNPKDPPTWSVLAGHSRTVSDSIKSLITAIRFVHFSPFDHYKNPKESKVTCSVRGSNLHTSGSNT